MTSKKANTTGGNDKNYPTRVNPVREGAVKPVNFTKPPRPPASPKNGGIGKAEK